MKKMLIITLLSIAILGGKHYQENAKDLIGPMGYKLDYIRKLSDKEYEYKDTQTNIHYIVLIEDNGDYFILSPIFKNVYLEVLKTE